MNPQTFTVRPLGASRLARLSADLGVLSFLLFAAAGLPAVVLAILGLREIRHSRQRLAGSGQAIFGLVAGGLSTVATLCVGPLLISYWYEQGSEQHLHQLAAGCRKYENANGTGVPTAICNQDGKPILSWRVALLPDIGESRLYKRFKLNEPWNGPNNIKLLYEMPQVYALPGYPLNPPGYTNYRVFVGDKTAFNWQTEAELSPTSESYLLQRLLIVESNRAVPWTKPDELSYDPARPLPPLGGHYLGGFSAVTTGGDAYLVRYDGSAAYRVLNDRSEQQLRDHIATPVPDGEVLSPGDW